MFCSRCGAQVTQDARFCYQCGSAISQSAPQYQQPQYQAPQYQQPPYQAPPPQNAYGYGVISDGVNMVYPDGHSELGDLTVTATELRFAKKSKIVRVAFGALGSSMEQGRDALLIPVSEIAYGQKTRIGLNGNVYQLTLRNGQCFKLCVEHPRTIKSLQERFG